MKKPLLITLMTVFDGQRLIALCTSRFGAPLCCLILGAISSLGLAPYNLWPVTLLSLVLLMMLLVCSKSLKVLFFASMCYFGAFNTVSLWWLNFVIEGFGQIPAPFSWLWVSLCGLILALHHSLLALIAKALSRGSRVAFLLFLLPAAFTAADATVSLGPLGFPWMNFGNLALTGPFKAYLPLIGARGASLMFCLAAGSAALAALRQYPYLPVAGVIVAFGLVFSSTRYTTDGSDIRAYLVQGNVPQEVRWDPNLASQSLATYWDLSKPLLSEGSLVIWPEGALPFYLTDSVQLMNDLQSAFSDAKASLILGSLRRAPDGRHNSMIRLGAGVTDKPLFYDKRKLVPLGEFVPFATLLRPLGRMFNIPMSDFVPPEHDTSSISANGVKFIPAICYETIFPETLMSNDSEDSGAILMISNDAWFGSTRGPLEHLAIARVRSMELQKPMLRATSNGITAVIGADGTVMSALPRDQASVLDARVRTMKGKTPYSRFGNLALILICLLLSAAGLAISRLKHKEDPIEKLVRP